MKKIIYLLAVLLGLQGCEKESFDYNIYQPVVADIDSIYFSTGSPSLIVDGKAALQFVLEAYRSVQIKGDNGVLRDTLMFVDYKSLPPSAVKIFVDGQEIDGMEYTTEESVKTSLDFYAQIGDKKSGIKHVQLRKPQEILTKRYVDVIFHVFELSPLDAAYDDLTYQEITRSQLEEAVSYANEVFNNVRGKDPNGASAGIEFRLAQKNASGASLAIPGYNRIIYDSSWKASATANFAPANFTTRINATAAHQWNKDMYLNIYIMPSAANTSLGNNRAGFQIVPAGETPIPGIAQIVASENDVPTNDFYTNYGLGIHRTIFFPGTDRMVEIASYLGIYYGLYRTTDAADYVHDTRKYILGNNSLNNLLKVGIDGEKFLANNALDDIRYASLRNCFTQGQIERMRLVMERSPVRKAWFLE